MGKYGTVDEAIRAWQNAIQTIHIPAGQACRGNRGVARLACVIRELKSRSRGSYAPAAASGMPAAY